MYIKMSLSLGGATNSTDLTTEPVACPVWASPSNLTGVIQGTATPFPWSVANVSNIHPIASFWLQVGTCQSLYLPYDNNLLSAGNAYYWAGNYNSTGDNKIQFKYFCTDNTCGTCLLDSTYTVGPNGCVTSTDRHYVNVPVLGGKQTVLTFHSLSKQSTLRTTLTSSLGRQSLCGGTNCPITMQFKDKSCGSDEPNPVLYRVGFNAGSSAVDCFIGGLVTTQSYGVICPAATANMTVLSYPGSGSCNSFVGGTAMTGSNTVAQPGYVLDSTGTAATCLVIGCDKTGNQFVSTSTFCAARVSSTSDIPSSPGATAICPATTTGAAAATTAAAAATTAGANTASSLVLSVAAFAAAFMAALLM